ncbi:hypothetical protein PDK35_02380 [Bacillus cereus group sp. TH153LC]|uniref:hypothetical protein n=1 Tax=Bacillus cereus group sp. TH153LC TaxID=3018059 RepID=UPI0022E233D6|nr:hypothetical protein [Bacillus cereus group sp. TH153LC]MDA1658822.1 hypothetical protein [Bacillus cereus group sp. TH153LC]
MSDMGGTSFYTESVSQAFEDALVAEILRVFGEDTRVYSSAKTGQIPPECVIFTAKPMNFQRASDNVQRRTIMIDVAVVTERDKGWTYDMLMKLKSISLGDVKKVIPSGRFSEVEGIVHFTSYMYLVEVD